MLTVNENILRNCSFFAVAILAIFTLPTHLTHPYPEGEGSCLGTTDQSNKQPEEPGLSCFLNLNHLKLKSWMDSCHLSTPCHSCFQWVIKLLWKLLIPGKSESSNPIFGIRMLLPLSLSPHTHTHTHTHMHTHTEWCRGQTGFSVLTISPHCTC